MLEYTMIIVDGERDVKHGTKVLELLTKGWTIVCNTGTDEQVHYILQSPVKFKLIGKGPDND